MSTTISPRDVLIANFAKLDQKQQNFAASLLSARNPSEKQKYWIKKLADDAVKPKSPPPTGGNVNNISTMIAFVGKARGKLKWPKIIFNIDDITIKISVSGGNSKYPGSINVVNYNSRTWYGRIMENGDWKPSPILDDSLSLKLLAGLQKFASNPAKEAAKYGHLTGNCCFCLLPLTDERSTSVGYGPICAGNYGLPWGE